MISKTKISKRTKKKTNPELVKTIMLAKKNNYLELAKVLSKPSRHQKKINLTEINGENEKSVIIPGKVLGSGEIDKKISIYALSFSKQALEKLKKSGCEACTILNAIEKNHELNGIKTLK